MPETTVTARPASVDELVTRFGEPAYEYPIGEPVRLHGRIRQCWAWLVPGGTQVNVVIDDLGDDGYHAAARAFGRWADMQIGGPPTDDEMRKLVALAWPEAVADA